jgi:glycosyltransferase involved in cell wall biosynthesis
MRMMHSFQTTPAELRAKPAKASLSVSLSFPAHFDRCAARFARAAVDCVSGRRGVLRSGAAARILKTNEHLLFKHLTSFAFFCAPMLLHSNKRGPRAHMPLSFESGRNRQLDIVAIRVVRRSELAMSAAQVIVRGGTMNPHLVCVGGEDHTLRIPFLLAMQERGFRVTAVSTASAEKFDAAGIEHHSYHFDRFTSKGGDWTAVGSLRKLLLSLKPDIVQSYDTKPNLLTPFAVRGSAPVVRTINGLGWVFSSSEPRALALRPAYCVLQGLASRMTMATVFQNREDQAFFKRFHMLGSSSDVLIGSSGIDADGFEMAQARGPSAQKLRAELGLEDAEIIMFVGRLTRQKGIPTLLKAIPQIVSARPLARIVLVGPWDSEGSFAVDRKAVEACGRHVLTLGPRPDVPSLLGMADLFAFPTEYREGIPRVLLEAGLSGLPIVATQMPGCSDVVEHGHNGLLVPPRDPAAFAAAVIELLRDPERSRAMGERSRPLVRQRFELARITGLYSDLYHSVLSGRSARQPSQPVTGGALERLANKDAREAAP